MWEQVVHPVPAVKFKACRSTMGTTLTNVLLTAMFKGGQEHNWGTIHLTCKPYRMLAS
jgi:hypothetical protein